MLALLQSNEQELETCQFRNNITLQFYIDDWHMFADFTKLWKLSHMAFVMEFHMTDKDTKWRRSCFTFYYTIVSKNFNGIDFVISIR